MRINVPFLLRWVVTMRLRCSMTMRRVPYQIRMELESTMDAPDDYAVAMGIITRQGAELHTSSVYLARGLS